MAKRWMGKQAVDSVDFKSLFEATPGAYLILAPDAPLFSIIAANDAYCRATMTVRGQILGRGLFEVFPDNPDDPTASGESNLRSSLLRVLEFRRPDAMAIQKYDIRKPDNEGGGFEERYWSPLNSPLLDAGGNVTAIIHRVQDVTDLVRRDAESARLDKLAQEQHAIITQLRAANRELARRIEENERLDRERRFAIEAKQATETALQESEVRFRTLAENLPGGPAAVALLESGAHVDLLFTDMVMPGGMSGRQLADTARELRPGLRVLFTSGYAENAAVHQGRVDRGAPLLRKPYRRRDLAMKVRQVLEVD